MKVDLKSYSYVGFKYNNCPKSNETPVMVGQILVAMNVLIARKNIR